MLPPPSDAAGSDEQATTRNEQPQASSITAAPQPASRRVTAETEVPAPSPSPQAPVRRSNSAKHTAEMEVPAPAPSPQGPVRKTTSAKRTAEAPPQLRPVQSKGPAAKGVGPEPSPSAPAQLTPVSEQRREEAAQPDLGPRKGSLSVSGASDDAQAPASPRAREAAARSVSFQQPPDSPGKLGEHRRRPSIFARERQSSSEPPAAEGHEGGATLCAVCCSTSGKGLAQLHPCTHLSGPPCACARPACLCISASAWAMTTTTRCSCMPKQPTVS